MKQLPLGTEEFKEIIENNNYYVDKTKSIELIEEFGTSRKVFLFTRPRRFGKTLFLSTLKYFYDIDNKDENSKLFKGLYIEDSPFFNIQGTYPVISLTMKSIETSDIKKLKEKILNNLIIYINKIRTFGSISVSDKILLKKLDNGDETVIEEALLHLSRLYYEHYNKKVIILIDEYEAPLLNALQNGYHKEALDFFRTFYSSALKTNPYLEKGILTGITRISQASIFSGLNNFIVYDYNKDEFSDAFGFTQDEVNQALKYYNLEPNKELIKEYYDGYRFGYKEIYNPWSILNFLANKKLDFYWAATSSTKIIKDLLYSAPDSFKQTYIDLAAGNSVRLNDINFSQLVLESLNDPTKVFDFMIAAGYLNYDFKTKQAKIVNKEVLQSLPEITSKGLYENSQYYYDFKNALSNGNLVNLEKLTNNLFQNTFSYHDFPLNAKEVNYHIFLTTMLALLSIGTVKSNREAGSGRFDIVLDSYDEYDYSYVFEVKVAQTKDEIDTILDKGLLQIKEKNYLEAIKSKKLKAIVCFCFYNKDAKVKYELIK